MQHTNAYGKRFCARTMLALGALCFSHGSFAYCSSQGNNTSYEWIDSVSLGSHSNHSGSDNGYLNATQQTIDLAAGTVPISLDPGFRSSSYNEQWRVWIDFNQDNLFQSTEQVYSGSSSSSLTGSITIPNDAMSGETRMRVSMQYGGAPNSCGNFSYGEVEDYTVNLNVVDTSSPTVITTMPANAAIEVDVSTELEVTFSENIDPFSVNANTVLLSTQGVSVNGEVTIAGSTVVFTPDQSLQDSTSYDVLVSGVTDIAGNPLVQDESWSFTTASPDTLAPTIDSTSPQNGDVDVANNIVLQAKFSEAIDEQTINASSFTVSDGISSVAGSVQVFGDTAQYYLDEPLDFSTDYTATINGSVSDLNGNEMGQDYSWSFVSRAYQADYCASSANNYSSFWVKSVEIKNFTASFQGTPFSGYRNSTSTVFDVSRFFNSLQLTPEYSNTLYPVFWRIFIDYNQDGVFANDEIVFDGNGTGAVNGSFSIPDSALGGHTRLRVSMQHGSMPLACGTFSNGQVVDFRVLIPEPVADTTAPTVTSVSPIDGATDVGLASVITAQFSEELSLASINAQNVVLNAGVSAVAANVNFDASNNTVTLVPLSTLDADTLHTVELSNLIEDVAGNALVAPYSWSFTTAAEQANVYALSGAVSANGSPLAGVSVAATGDSVFNATTNSNGAYAFAGMPVGTYAITANKVGYSFTPQSLSVDFVDSDIAAVDFTGQPASTPLVNGDFETGDFSGFTLFETENGTVSSAVINIDANNDGSLSQVGQFVVGVTGMANIGTPGGGGLYQNVVLQDGDLNVTLDVSASTASNNGDGGLAEIFFDGQLMDSHNFGSVTAGVKDYETLSFNIPNVAAGVHEIRIQFTRNYFKASVSQLLDNIVLTGSSIGN